MEIKKLSDKDLDAVVGGTGAVNRKAKPYCSDCGAALTFYCNVDEAAVKMYCPSCKKIYLFNTAAGILTDTGETVPF